MAECKLEFVERLPFQAIICSLAHFRSAKDDWSDEAGDKLFNLTRDMKTDEALVVECAVVQKALDKYCVNLKSDNGVMSW